MYTYSNDEKVDNQVRVETWLKLDLESRQQHIKRFYAAPTIKQASEFLSFVKAPQGYGVYASIGPHYQFAIFGRDSIEVAEDLLEDVPALAKEVILFLASLQGFEFDEKSEQEVGKIHHEYRALHFNGQTVSEMAKKILASLGPVWGGSQHEMLYYGSADATPLFIRLVYRYTEQYGHDILEEMIKGRDGQIKTLRDRLRLATAWLVAKITDSSFGLFEYNRINPKGLYNQSWEDSNISYIHTDGNSANADNGIAAVELQGYAYDALYAAAELVAVDEREARSLKQLAHQVRDCTLAQLWMPEQHYFAMGLDRDNDGLIRRIATITTNPALLLETGFFNEMPDDKKSFYIESIVRMLFSDDCFTAAGLRLRAKRHADLVQFADYHGSLVTWPKQTYDIAKGLRLQGFNDLADILEACILHAVSEAGEFYEYFYVGKNNEVKYHYRYEAPDEPTFHDFGAAGTPEPGQAWTISAALAIALRPKQTQAAAHHKAQLFEQTLIEQEQLKKFLYR